MSGRTKGTLMFAEKWTDEADKKTSMHEAVNDSG